MQGAVSRVGEHETAFAHRDSKFALNIISMWMSPAESDIHVQWADDLWQSMQPFWTGGVYSNFLGDEGRERVRAAYGDNYDRLAALKSKYDPTNFFHVNQNIEPLAS
jgi:FAD/FMN-containing dehydrogenase